MFTREQILEIQAKLASLGYRDTDFEKVSDLDGNEIISIVKDGINRTTLIKDIASKFGTETGGSDCECGTRVDDLESVVDDLKTLLEGFDGRFSEIEDEVFQFVASYSSKNSGNYEIGTSVTPSATVAVTRKGVNIPVTVTTSPASTISGQSFTGTPVSSGSVSYTATAHKDGKDIPLTALTWSFLRYRYYGPLSSMPTDIPSAVRGVSSALSETATLGATDLAADKYYLFAVYGTKTLVCRDSATNGEVTGCTKGTCSIARKNGTGSDTYSYIIVPASKNNWSFKITNS